MVLTDEQIQRYSRHIILKDVGGIGQEKILKSKVLIIGAGGLGSPAALYLAAAGVGTLGIADNDIVDLSNLQRQVIHFTPDVGKPKVDSARDKIEKMNPDVKIKTYKERVNANNISEIIKDYDFIIDGTDNFTAKFLINDACVLNKKPFSHGGVLRFHGQTITFIPGKACLRCLFNSPPPEGMVPTCSEAGILGIVAGILGTIQASEALKYILGIGDLLTDSMLYFDLLNTEFKKLSLERNPECTICGDNSTILELKDHEQQVCEQKAI